MITIIRQIFLLLSPKERIKAYMCFSAMLVMAVVDVLGVASIMPFIAVISDPDAIEHHAKLAWLFNKLHFSTYHGFLIFLGLVVLGILIIGNTISMFTTWSILKFTYAREYSLSKRLFTHYLYRPYSFFLDRNSSELSKNILSEVMIITNRAFIPGMQLLAKSIITILILVLLLMVDPVLAFVVSFILGGAYVVIYSTARKKLTLISKRCVESSRKKYKIVTEAFHGIKDIKLLGNENYFVQEFSRHAFEHTNEEAAGNLIAQLPRYALETIAFGGVLIIIIYLLVMQHNIRNALPLLALYAFVSLRLMPALQQIFTSVAFLRMSTEALAVITKDLKEEYTSQADRARYGTASDDLPFQKEIELRNIHFSYSNTHQPIIKNINFTIPVNSTIGLVGMTGAGKTTVVDLILGLILPDRGEILVDGIYITPSNLASWKRRMGYVPQSIFLADDSVVSNIAFGVAPAEVDMNAVEKAAKIANIHDFVINNLEKGYHSIVGDRGIRLSGGQRQRIGIARALYYDPDVLVLDEATSALDSVTEDAILEAIRKLSRRKTIIIVAHRLTTLTECDTIHFLEEGKLLSSDSYQGLLKSCQPFKTMAQVGELGKTIWS